MDGYKVIKRLGKGTQGSVFLVQTIPAGKKYVLKKVECNDETEANKAFKEAMALQELQHPCICGYKEFFVTWDKEEEAMFVCIVMEYYQHGDLEKILRQKRNKQQAIEEVVVKKWFGQMVEALVFIHNKHVIHRDLKPSNIFMKENLEISLGDFGVATIMGDARTQTRTTVGSMNWMAPEVLERPYDERSDVWSAGCIVLEMCSCSFYSVSQISRTLFEIKNNPEALEDALEKASKVYSAGLISIIRMMLRRNFKQRPTAVDLMEIPYVKECLALNDSALVDQKKKSDIDVSTKPVPKGRGVVPVTDYLHSNSDSESCVSAALSYLDQICNEVKSPKSLTEAGIQAVVGPMKKHVKNADIQMHGCRVLESQATLEDPAPVLHRKEVVSSVPLAMRAHSSSTNLLICAINLLMSLSDNDSASEIIGQVGGIQDILAAMRDHENNEEIITACCKALWSLTVNEHNAKIVTEEKGVRDVVRAMSKHSMHRETIESAAAALLSLSMEDENLELVEELDFVGHLLTALKNHPESAAAVKNSCMALATLVEADEESAYKVCSSQPKPGAVGLYQVLQAYQLHKDCSDVVESVCTLFMELMQYGDLLQELTSHKVPQTLSAIAKQYQGNKAIVDPCSEMLAKFSGSRGKGN